jgi:hypothetical protein
MAGRFGLQRALPSPELHILTSCLHTARRPLLRDQGVVLSVRSGGRLPRGRGIECAVRPVPIQSPSRLASPAWAVEWTEG